MVKIEKKQKNNILFLLILIAVFFSSMLGAQIGRISLNKLALLPLEIYLILYILMSGKIFLNKNVYPLLIFYLVQIVGSLFGLFNMHYNDIYNGYNSRLINNVIQNIFIYFPILIGLGLLKDKYPIFEYFKNSLIYVVRFQCAWAIIQFLLWHTASFDLNNYIFIDLLKGGLGKSFDTALIYLNGKTQLRATGLNHEPAALATLMLLGVCFDKRLLPKFFYFFACVLAMSRTGIVAVLAVLLIQAVYGFYQVKDNKGIDILGKFLLVGIVLLIIFLVLYSNIPFIKRQVDGIIDRFFNMENNKDGSERHIMYPLYAIYSWIIDLNLLQKIWGVGARVSGLVFVNSKDVSINMTFNNEMRTTAWSVECDMAEILLGDGIIGFCIYLSILIKLIKTKRLDFLSLGIGLFVYGFMYANFSSTLIQITLIIIFSTLKQEPQSKIICAEKIKKLGV